MCVNKSRAYFTYYVHTTTCGAHKLIHPRHEIHNFPPVGRPLAVSGCSGFGIRFCLADESNVPSGWSWRAVLLVRTGCQAEIVYIQNHHDWCSLSFPPPVSFSPAAAVHHKQDPALARHDRNSSSSSSLSSSSCFPLLSLESPPTPRWQIHPQASGTSAVTTRQLDKLATTCLWPPSNVLELLWMI